MIAHGYQRERIWEPGADWQRNKSGLYLPGEQPAQAVTDLVAIDLFAGAGGFSLGFHQGGWHVSAAVEWEPAAAMTYLHNLAGPDTVLHFADRDMERRWHKALRAEEKRCRKENLPGFAFGRGWIATKPDQRPVEHFYLGDIRAFTAEQVMADLSIKPGDAGCVFGGPPCQGFSMAGQRNVMDPRNSLVFEFMHFVVRVRPKTFIMENVPGMLTMNTAEGVPVIDMLARIAQDGNFMAADAFRATMKAQAESLGFLRSDTQPTKPGRKSESSPDTSEQLNLLA
jgi:DNA (cytosine-5)-methyltransferase 1